MLKFDEKGLIPAVVQDYISGRILMLAYMNEETLKETIETGRTVFYSRSRQERWRKGDTSGNIQKVVSIRLDCDGDCLLIRVEQTGAACHTGNKSCFLLEEGKYQVYVGSDVRSASFCGSFMQEEEVLEQLQKIIRCVGGQYEQDDGQQSCRKSIGTRQASEKL